MLKFDEEKHIYTYNGNRLPSVTQVLGEWKRITIGGGEYYYSTVTGNIVLASIFDEAADFGRATHKGAKLILEGVTLDWDGMDEKTAWTLKAFEDFLSDHKVKPYEVEKPRCSMSHWVAGTPDFWGEIDGELVIVDFKTGKDFPLVGPQTAGYEVIIREDTGERRASKRFSLKLHPKGYSYDRLSSPDDVGFFLSRVYQHKVLSRLFPKYNKF